MSTLFPSGIDSFTTKIDSVDDVIAADTNNLQDAVLALQTKIGVNGSAVATTINKKLSVAEAAVAQALGVSQTWQNVTGSRTSGVTYTNSTGRSIAVSISVDTGANGASTIDFYVSGVRTAVSRTVPPGGFNTWSFISIVIPPGVNYSAVITASNGTIWFELR